MSKKPAKKKRNSIEIQGSIIETKSYYTIQIAKRKISPILLDPQLHAVSHP